jgi:hypothetical protein
MELIVFGTLIAVQEGEGMQGLTMLLIYSSQRERERERLSKIISARMPKEKSDICRTIEALSQRLRQPTLEQRVLVLLIDSREELKRMLEINELLDDTKILLVLPGMDSDTIACGHRLHPRYISDYTGDFSDIVSVLSRIRQSQRRQSRPRRLSVASFDAGNDGARKGSRQ